MGTKGLQGKEICAIIRECAKAGVSEFEAGEFKVKFGTQVEKVGIPTPNEGIHLTPPQLGTTEEQDKNQEIDYIQRRAADEAVTAQDMVDNPAMFEKNLIDSMLFEEGRDDSEERGRTREVL